MKEKDIKEILDDKFESMAPDLVNKICENKIEKINSEIGISNERIQNNNANKQRLETEILEVGDGLAISRIR